MKKLLLLLFFLISHLLSAQTSTEQFETESNGSTSFTDNGVIFNIISHVSVFDIQGNFPGTGWSGTANDNRYIDNSNDSQAPPSFSIKTTSNLFKVNRFWMYLSALNLDLNVQGSLTITGKLGGVTKFTQTKTTGFATSLGTTNGYTLIDMTNLNGQNYSNIVIDELRITANGAFRYVGLDAFTWVKDSNIVLDPNALTATTSQTDVSCNGGANGSATVSVSGGTPGYTYSWAPLGGTGATATGLVAGTYTVTITDANNCQTTRSVTVEQPIALTATTSFTNVSCNGGSNGSATVSVSGGTGAYTYLWAPSGGTEATATGLAAGTYTVTITDANSCTTKASVTIEQPTALTAATSQTNISCNGGANGSATVSVSGGTGAYTYLWAPSGGTEATATGLVAGTYTVTITDANACTITRTFTITQPTALTATTSQTNIACNGVATGSASVSVSGGTAPYTYSWAPLGGTGATATGLVAGTYTVTITDANACTITHTFTITQPTALTANTSQTNVSCNGGSDGTATVTPLGGTGTYTYSWYPSGGNAATATGLAAGIYTVTVMDANACTMTYTFAITQPAALTATTSQTNVSCNGGSNGTATVTPLGGTGTYTYSWYPSGGNAATATGLAAGIYTVTVMDLNSCAIAAATATVFIIQPSALTATTSQTNVSCNGGSNGSATVTATGGTAPYTYSWAPSGGTGATATGLAAGTYTVTVTDANSCTTTASVTIEQPTALTATTSKTDVSCNGGSNGTATVIPLGGAGGYTYSWAPSGGTAATATGLAPGNYTVTITDANSCTTTASVTITEPNVVGVPEVTNNDINYKYGDNTAELIAINNADHTLKWYEGDNKILLTKAPIPDTNKIGKQTYWVSQVNSTGCESDLVKIEVTITPANLTVTAEAKTKVYGSADPALTYEVIGLVNAEKESDVLVGSLTRIVGEDVGTYVINQGTLVVNSNYTMTFEGSNLVINKAPLIITADTQSKVYGSVDPALAYKVTGLVNNDALTGSLIRVSGENVGSYAITQGDLKASINYMMTFAGSNLIITPADLTVTADAKTKVYGSVDPTLSYKVLGLVNTEKESDVLVGSLTRIAGESVGTYLINQGTLLANGNYTLDFKTNNLEITPANLTVTADAKTKVYGSADPVFTYKVSGLVNAEKESDVLVGSLTCDVGENLGSYAISQGTLVVNSNYTMTFTGSNLVVTKAPLTVTADTQSKVYGSVDPTLTYKVTGLVNNDALTGSLIRVSGENVGSYAITQGDLKASSNYMMTFAGSNLTITPANLTVTADAKTKVYGSVDPVLTYKVSGLVNAEKESDVLVGSSIRIPGESVGTYAINQGTLVVNSNYTMTFTGSNLVVTKAPLTVTADAQSKVYGSVDPALTYKVDGLKYQDTVSGVLTRDAGESVGTYVITQGGLAANANYSLAFIGSNLVVTKAPFTVTADAQSKVYGSADPAFTYKVTGLVNGDKEVDVLSGNLSRDKGENVGLYIINQGALLANANYSLAFNKAELTITKAPITGVKLEDASYVYDGQEKELLISGNLPKDATVSYVSNKQTEAGVYEVTALVTAPNYIDLPLKAKLTISKAAITGVKLEDASYVYDGNEKALLISGNLPKDATVSYVSNKQTEAGVYEVTALVTAPNYIDLLLKAKLTISKAVITGVKLEDASYVYDGQEKALLINGNLPKNATVSYVANKQTEAGVYEVTALVTAPNYIDLPLKAKLTISKAAITGVKLEDASYVYDGQEKALLISGKLPKDAKVSYVVNKKTEAGMYEVTALVTAPNYIDLPLKAKLTISKAKQEITFNKLTPIVFDKNIQLQLTASSNSGLPVSYTYSYEGSKAAAIVSPSGTVTVVSPGRIVITAHQVGNNNYAPAKSISQTLVIINDEALITDWKINGQRQGALSSTGVFRQDCNEITDQMNIELETSVGAEVSTGSKFSILTPKAGIYRQEVVVTSQSGSTTKKYEIVIERPFNFDDIVIQKFDNTLLVNNNPQTNGGYRFIGYRWYKNDQLIGTEQVYSVGNKKEDLLDLNALYRVELVTDKGEVLHSCASTIRYTHTKNIQLYPNPVVKNGVLEVAIDYPNTALDQMSASVYSLTGQFLFTVPLQGAVSKVNLPSNMVEGVYIMIIKIEGKTKTFRFMVKP